MSKCNKQQAKRSPAAPVSDGGGAGDSALATPQGRPPMKRPALLAVSVVLLALWFVFLLATAVRGSAG